MTIIVISIMIFVMMLLFPILFSLFFLRRGTGEVLDIQLSKTRDPRYFVKSFTRLFDQKWANYDGSGKILLSREENILEADGLTEYPPVCHSIIFAENLEFRPHAGVRFEKEVYTRKNAYLFGIEAIRAICSKEDLVLGGGTQVLRWVDAEGTLTANDHCDLGISASSTTKMVIGNNCRFRRLYAPMILFGRISSSESQLYDNSQNVNPPPLILYRFLNIRFVDDDLVDDAGVLTGSIITTHNISVLNRLTVKGHIRSHKSIRLCDHAVVYGNLFAEGDIYLGHNARVYGSVFTQENLFAEDGVTIGQPGKTRSVIARGKIIFSNNCCVYGYVSSEAGGECCPDNNVGKTDTAILPAMFFPHTLVNYLHNKFSPTVLGTILLLAIITTSISGVAILNEIKEKDRLLEEKQTTAMGLTQGVDSQPNRDQLKNEPTLVTEDYVYFQDRVLERFHYEDNAILQSSQALSSVMTSLPEDVNKYLMLVPMSISLENDQRRRFSDDPNRAIAEIYASLPSSVITLDAAGALLEHKNEYVFFVTDNAWTALGAYYAAKEFCASAGIDIIPLGNYGEYRFISYRGNIRTLPHTESLRNYRDYVSYYLLKGAANEQTITARHDKDEYVTYKSPTVALSRRGYDIFIGSYFSHSILSGDAKNGKTLMILGDKYSKALAPWLTPYYEKVVLVNLQLFDGGSKKFWELFSQYSVTDLLVMEAVQNIGDSRNNNLMREISSKP